MDNKHILVFYVGVAGLDMNDVENYMRQISKKLTPQTVDGEIIFIPVLSSYDTRVECINPRYVTDVELINENHKILSELKYELTNQLNMLKNKNENEYGNE